MVDKVTHMFRWPLEEMPRVIPSAVFVKDLQIIPSMNEEAFSDDFLRSEPVELDELSHPPTHEPHQLHRSETMHDALLVQCISNVAWILIGVLVTFRQISMADELEPTLACECISGNFDSRRILLRIQLCPEFLGFAKLPYGFVILQGQQKEHLVLVNGHQLIKVESTERSSKDLNDFLENSMIELFPGHARLQSIRLSSVLETSEYPAPCCFWVWHFLCKS
mmetsp:Transcript_34620/g.62777  ORF Transcript_34620/g.62777 Transcript_34620/m.62777 type:complete len:222 (+) Transcript_34620:1481-2146(+)